MKLVLRSRSFAFFAGPIVDALRVAVLALVLVIFEIASPAKALADNKAVSDNKIALVIGNSQYRKVQPLTNPANDAADIAASLQRLGYSVQHFTDLDYKGFRQALIEFGKAAKTADKAIIFYAGHGVEIDGKNWLIPVDAEIKSEIDVYAEGINLETLIDLSVLPKVVGLVVLDACRNNPFVTAASGGRSLSNVDSTAAASTDNGAANNTAQSADSGANALPGTPAGGLAPIDVTDNVLVAFSAAAGTTANDGAGRNSPYSGALLRYVEKPGLEINYLFRDIHDEVLKEIEINYLFRDIHDEVLKETLNTQEPAVYGTLSKDEIFLNENGAHIAATDSEGAAEKLAWSFVRTTNDIAVLRRFAAQFPASQHRAEILARTEQLENAEKFAWEMVEKQHSASAYQAFLDLYPFGDHADSARVTLASLATSSPSDAARGPGIDLPGPPPATFDLASSSAEIIDKPDEPSDSIEKVWDILKGSQDQDVVGRFSDKFPSLRHGRVPRNSDVALRPVNSTEWMLKTAGDSEVNDCFGGQSDACVKAIEKYPDYVQLRFQLCRTTRQRGGDAGANHQGPNDNGCMADAVEDARDRGYLVSAFTRSRAEKKRNQEYRKAVKQVHDRVSTVVSNTVSNVVSNVVNSTVSNVVSNATSAAIGRATSVAVAPSIVIPSPAGRWDSRLGSIRSAVAVAPAGNRAGAGVVSTPAINVAPKGAGGAGAAGAAGAAASGAAGKAAGGAAGNAAGKAASGAAGNAAGKAASGAAGNAAGRAASGAAGNAAGKAASGAASSAAGRAASGAASSAAGRAASGAASNAASHAAGRAASYAAANAASRAAGNAASNAASRAASHAASKAASQAASNAAGRVAIPSDIRLKQDIVALGHTVDGLGLYRYRYIGDDTLYVGVMAQEVAERRPDAVVHGADGYLRVDYGKLGVPFLTFVEWSRRHAAEIGE